MNGNYAKCPFHNTDSITEFDALDENARANPWPFYDWLREHDTHGVYKLPQEKNFYVIHKYEDVKRVFNDTENFSSKIIPTVKSPFLALMDGEDHARIRSIIAEVFTSSFLNRFEVRINEIIEASTNELIKSKNPELFKIWADKIPLSILSELFGLEVSDSALQKLHNDVIAINKALFVVGGTGLRRKSAPDVKEKIKISYSIIQNTKKILRLRKLLGSSGFRELLQMFRPEKNKQETPRPDFKQFPSGTTPFIDLMLFFATVLTDGAYNNKNAISILRNAIKNKSATVTEMMMTAAFIIFAGYETTSSILSNCVVHLARHPEDFRKIKDNRELIDDFIEESLRYYTPVGRFLRRVTNDMDFNGYSLPKDALILLMPGAANTDSEKFSSGCEFNMNRNNVRQHLSFGKGAHFCIGAPLARLQISTALNLLISKVDYLNLDESKPLRMVVNRDNGILRYEEVWLNF